MRAFGSALTDRKGQSERQKRGLRACSARRRRSARSSRSACASTARARSGGAGIVATPLSSRLIVGGNRCSNDQSLGRQLGQEAIKVGPSLLRADLVIRAQLFDDLGSRAALRQQPPDIVAASFQAEIDPALKVENHYFAIQIAPYDLLFRQYALRHKSLAGG